MEIRIHLIDKNEKVLYDGDFTSIPISETFIIKKSLDLFSEGEPCAIHRNYILKKINLGLDDLLQTINNSSLNEICASEIPAQMMELFLYYGWNAAKIRICS